MSEPMNKDELETLKASEMLNYVPPYTNSEIEQLYRRALARERSWKRLWHKIWNSIAAKGCAIGPGH
ncbi:MAG: hypothetical protein J2P49_09845 [Methylocapsa sp.]|nr:hypothetical protein [Methylocapsa sp.]